MVDVLTRAIRARQAVSRPETAVVGATGTSNPDRAETCARALVPPQRKGRSLKPRAVATETEWREIERETETVRVEASDGSGAWVAVERARRITFRTDSGARMTLVLTP